MQPGGRLLLLIICLHYILFLNLNAQKSFTSIQVKIFDEKNEITGARVRFTDLEGKFYAPEGARADFPIINTTVPQSKEEGLILDNDRKFNYSTGDFKILKKKKKITL